VVVPYSSKPDLLTTISKKDFGFRELVHGSSYHHHETFPRVSNRKSTTTASSPEVIAPPPPPDPYHLPTHRNL